MKKYIVYSLPLLFGISFMQAMERPPRDGAKHSLAEEDKTQPEGKKSRVVRQLVMPEFNEEVVPEHQALLRAAAQGDLEYIRQNLPAEYFQRDNVFQPLRIERNHRYYWCEDVKERGLLCFAALNHHVELFQYLLPQSPYDEVKLYDQLRAALKGDEEIASIFVKRLFSDTYAAYRQLFTAFLLDCGERIHGALQSLNFQDVLGNENQRYRPLHAAVLLNSAVGVREILARNCPINIVNSDDHTALSYAVDLDHAQVVEALLQAGADANSDHPDGPSCIWQATHHRRAEILELLLTHGGNAHEGEGVDDGSTLLHEAAFKSYPECVIALLNHHANINARSRKGETPLHCIFQDQVCEEESLSVARLLLEHGVDINARITAGKHIGKTALSYALKYADNISEEYNDNEIKIIQELLLWGARLGTDVNRGREIFKKLFRAKPLIVAVFCRNFMDLLRDASNASREDVNEALTYAIAQRLEEAIVILTRSGAQPHVGFQFLQNIVLNRPLSREAREAYEEIRNNLGYVPSLVELIIGRRSIHDCLLQDVARLPPELRERLLSSILSTAVHARNSVLTEKALAAGADPGSSPIFLQGLDNPEIVCLLAVNLRHRLLEALKAGDARKIYKVLLAGAPADDSDGKPLLLHAAEFADAGKAFEMVNVLLAYGHFFAGVLQQLDTLQNRPEIAALIIEEARMRGMSFVEPAWLIEWRMRQHSQGLSGRPFIPQKDTYKNE